MHIYIYVSKWIIHMKNWPYCQLSLNIIHRYKKPTTYSCTCHCHNKSSYPCSVHITMSLFHIYTKMTVYHVDNFLLYNWQLSNWSMGDVNHFNHPAHTYYLHRTWDISSPTIPATHTIVTAWALCHLLHGILFLHIHMI